MGGNLYGGNAPETKKDENPFVGKKRKGETEMRNFVPGESLVGVDVSGLFDPEVDLGYVARDSNNYTHQWYVPKAYAVANFDLD